MSTELNPAVVLAALDNILEPITTHKATHLSIMRRRVQRLRDMVAQYVPVGHQFDSGSLSPAPTIRHASDTPNPAERRTQ